MIKLVQIGKQGTQGASPELTPAVARFARGWVIFFVGAAIFLLISMWARAAYAAGPTLQFEAVRLLTKSKTQDDVVKQGERSTAPTAAASTDRTASPATTPASRATSSGTSG